MADEVPYMPFWCKDWLAASSTRCLSLAERGVYIDLLCFQWTDGAIPDDLSKIARLLGISIEETHGFCSVLENQFPVCPDGHRRNPRLEEERAKVMVKINANRANGRLGGRPKKGNIEPKKRAANTKKPNGLISVNPNETQTKPYHNHINKENKQRKDFIKPTLEEVALYMRELGLPNSKAESFIDHYTANGWKVGRNPMRDWKATCRTWKREWLDRNPQAKADSGFKLVVGEVR